MPRQVVQLIEGPGQARAQIGGRLLGEGHRRQPLDRDSGPRDQIQRPLHEQGRLAGSGAGHHHQVALELGHGAPSRGVVRQAGRRPARAHDSSSFRADCRACSSVGAWRFFRRSIA